VAPLAFVGNGHGDAAPGEHGRAGEPATDSAPQPTSGGSSMELNGVPLPAMAVVESETSIRPLVDRLLGGTRIVRDLAAATAAWRETNGAFHYVTLGGEMLSGHGVYTGGYNNGNGDGKAPASILGRKNQIADLQAAVGKLKDQVAEISRVKGGLQSEQTELEAGLQQAQQELRAQEVAIATHEGEFNALQNSQRLLHQKIDTVVYEIQSLAAQEQEGLQKRAGLAAQAGEWRRANRLANRRSRS
jgi:chromosome segregation protein